MVANFFYGYVILALCFLNMIFQRGVIGAFGVFYVALLEEFQWTHSSVATIASVNALVYALVCPLVGWSFDRFGSRILMPLGALLIGIGLILSGLSHSIWELYFSYGVLAGIGQAGLGFVTQSALISHWFVQRRATAVGIAAMGMGLGVLIIVPLAQILIDQMGWRMAFMALAGLGLCVVVPANAIFQRRDPEDVGQNPDGAPSVQIHETGPKRAIDPTHRQWTMGSVFCSFPYWALTINHLGLGFGNAMFYTHVVAYLVHQGFDKLLSATIVGLIGLTRFGGTVLWGFVSDRIGRSKAYAVAIAINTVGLLCLLAISSDSPYVLAYAFAILFGIGHSASNPTSAAAVADIFSGSRIGTIFGFLEISFGLGMALGAWLGGYVYDITGSYRWAFIVGLLSFVTSYLAIQLSMAWNDRSLARLRTGKSPT
jgi:MFS family permease